MLSYCNSTIMWPINLQHSARLDDTTSTIVEKSPKQSIDRVTILLTTIFLRLTTSLQLLLLVFAVEYKSSP